MGPRTEGSQPPSCRGREGGCRDGLVASKSRESWGLTSVGRAESACQILSLQSLLGLPGPPCAGRSEDGAVQGAESAERSRGQPSRCIIVGARIVACPQLTAQGLTSVSFTSNHIFHLPDKRHRGVRGDPQHSWPRALDSDTSSF